MLFKKRRLENSREEMKAHLLKESDLLFRSVKMSAEEVLCSKNSFRDSDEKK